MKKNNLRCLVIGAGLSGLVTAKELLDVGIEDVTIVEKSKDLGGVWRTHCWTNTTLTSSKWVTEFSSFPMPDEYPDFPTPEQMMDYLQAFAQHFDLEKRIHCRITVKAIERNENNGYDVITDQGIYDNYNFIVVCTGLHGKPSIPNIPGLERFQGTLIHGIAYKTPEPFRDQRVLCVGLGESGVGISSEISSVAAHTIVSGSSFAPVPRNLPLINIPVDLLSFWQIGRYMKDYPQLVPVGANSYTSLPSRLASAVVSIHPILKDMPTEWLPKAWFPYRWQTKLWFHPRSASINASVNLTRPDAFTDDILYLIKKNYIEPKGKVARLEGNKVYFEDGTQAEVDTIVMNTGYQASVLSLNLPDNLVYRHQDLYKGCFHVDLPNLAFVGFIRPTVGSIPAMAEMQARFVAQIFSGQKQLPKPSKLKRLIEVEARNHAREYPTIHARFPHVHGFDTYMYEMANLIGCQPQIWDHLSSWQQLQAYLLGSTQPLRFRQRGPGFIDGASEIYAARIAKYFSTVPGIFLRNYIFILFFYPYVLALLLGAILFWGIKLSSLVSVSLAILCWILYITVNVFRIVALIPLIIIFLIGFFIPLFFRKTFLTFLFKEEKPC